MNAPTRLLSATACLALALGLGAVAPASAPAPRLPPARAPTSG